MCYSIHWDIYCSYCRSDRVGGYSVFCDNLNASDHEYSTSVNTQRRYQDSCSVCEGKQKAGKEISRKVAREIVKRLFVAIQAADEFTELLKKMRANEKAGSYTKNSYQDLLPKK
jgi:hypothetical protein